jgi:ubiquinone/menaquinone biosynthesis C-methylase UbiE
MAAQLPSRSLILDLGSGAGIPIIKALLKADYRVTGLDSSAEMLAISRRNFPNTPAVLGDVRRCPFVDSCFDAAVSWA